MTLGDDRSRGGRRELNVTQRQVGQGDRITSHDARIDEIADTVTRNDNDNEEDEMETDGDRGSIGINVLAWNIENLLAKITLKGVCEFINDYDLVILSETYTFNTFDFSIKFPDFNVFHWPAEKLSRRGRASGG